MKFRLLPKLLRFICFHSAIPAFELSCHGTNRDGFIRGIHPQDHPAQQRMFPDAVQDLRRSNIMRVACCSAPEHGLPGNRLPEFQWSKHFSFIEIRQQKFPQMGRLFCENQPPIRLKQIGHSKPANLFRLHQLCCCFCKKGTLRTFCCLIIFPSGKLRVSGIDSGKQRNLIVIIPAPCKKTIEQRQICLIGIFGVMTKLRQSVSKGGELAEHSVIPVGPGTIRIQRMSMSAGITSEWA